MRKKAILLILAVSISTVLKAQLEETKNLLVGMDLTTDLWQDTPENVSPRTINRGMNIYGLYEFKLGESNFSFAAGLGWGVNSLYSNALIDNVSAEEVSFTQIPDSINYDKSKLVMSFLDVPLEFRYRGESGFKMALGFKAGYLVESHTKYKGNMLDGSGSEIKIKRKNIESLQDFRYGPYVRVGYRWLNFFGYYSLSNTFGEGQGPDMYPITVGISFLPY